MQQIFNFLIFSFAFILCIELSKELPHMRHKHKHLHHSEAEITNAILLKKSTEGEKSMFENCTKEIEFEGEFIKSRTDYCTKEKMTLNLNFFSVSLFEGSKDPTALFTSSEYWGILSVKELEGAKGCYEIVNIHKEKLFLICFKDEKQYFDFVRTLLRFMLCRRGYWPTPDIDCRMKPEATQISHSKFNIPTVLELEKVKDIFDENELSNYMSSGNANILLEPFHYAKNTV